MITISKINIKKIGTKKVNKHNSIFKNKDNFKISTKKRNFKEIIIVIEKITNIKKKTI